MSEEIEKGAGGGGKVGPAGVVSLRLPLPLPLRAWPLYPRFPLPFPSPLTIQGALPSRTQGHLSWKIAKGKRGSGGGQQEIVQREGGNPQGGVCFRGTSVRLYAMGQRLGREGGMGRRRVLKEVPAFVVVLPFPLPLIGKGADPTG